MNYLLRFTKLTVLAVFFTLLAACSNTPAPVAEPVTEETLESQATSSTVLAYNSYSGAASVNVFDTTGNYTTLRNLTLTSGWTTVVKVPYGILFYNANTGAAEFGKITATGRYRQVTSYSFWTGWTHIVNTPQGVLFYRASDSRSYLGTFDINGNFITINSNPGVSLFNRSHLVSTTYGVFFYSAVNGVGNFGRFDSNGVYQELRSGIFRAGWQHVVNTSRGVLFYRSMDENLPRLSALGKFDINGVYTEINSNPNAGPWQAEKIIRLTTGDIFFYAGGYSSYYGANEIGFLRSNGSYNWKMGNFSFPGFPSHLVMIK